MKLVGCFTVGGFFWALLGFLRAFSRFYCHDLPFLATIHLERLGQCWLFPAVGGMFWALSRSVGACLCHSRLVQQISFVSRHSAFANKLQSSCLLTVAR